MIIITSSADGRHSPASTYRSLINEYAYVADDRHFLRRIVFTTVHYILSEPASESLLPDLSVVLGHRFFTSETTVFVTKDTCNCIKLLLSHMGFL